MRNFILYINLIFAFSMLHAESFEKDTIKTSKGDLLITFVGHASLIFNHSGNVIYIDPSSNEADYSQLPEADLILITHHHNDHLDFNAINAISRENTIVIGTEKCATNNFEKTKIGIMKNGDIKNIIGYTIEAVPAYNIINKRADGKPYHPKGEGNGYIISIDDLRIFIAGDSENTKEMKSLKNIDIAFLPMNLPYTMTPEMVADAVRSFKPKILYPYHYGETDVSILQNLLSNFDGTEIRIRKMK